MQSVSTPRPWRASRSPWFWLTITALVTQTSASMYTLWLMLHRRPHRRGGVA